MKAVEVVHEHGGLAQELPVQLAPDGLCPAGLGQRQVQSRVRCIDVMPIAGRDDMAERVGIRHHAHLGIPAGTRGEIHEHDVVLCVCKRAFRPCKFRRISRIFAVKRAPALPVAVDDEFGRHAAAVLLGRVHRVGDIALRRTYDGFDMRLFQAVDDILFHKLVGRGHADCAEPVQRQNDIPELVVPFQNQQYRVALSDAERGQVGGYALAVVGQVPESDALFHALVVDPLDGALVRALFG